MFKYHQKLEHFNFIYGETQLLKTDQLALELREKYKYQNKLQKLIHEIDKTKEESKQQADYFQNLLDMSKKEVKLLEMKLHKQQNQAQRRTSNKNSGELELLQELK